MKSALSKYVFTLTFISLTSAYTFAEDVVKVGPNGHISITHVDGGKVWFRECEDDTIVRKLSDCKAMNETSLGTVEEVRNSLLKKIANGATKEDLEKYKSQQKEIALEITKKVDFQKEYGTKGADGKAVAIGVDKTTDLVKYNQLLAKQASNKSAIKLMETNLKDVEPILNAVMLKLNSGLNVLSSENKKPSKVDSLILDLLVGDLSSLLNYNGCDFKYRGCSISVDEAHTLRIYYGEMPIGGIETINGIYKFPNGQSCGDGSLKSCATLYTKDHCDPIKAETRMVTSANSQASIDSSSKSSLKDLKNTDATDISKTTKVQEK